MASSWPTPSSRKTISDMAVIAKAAVQAAPYAIDRVYSYLLPRDMGAQVGCRVLVPFGRGNRPSEAVILALSKGVPDKPLKTVSALLDEEPVVSDREIRLALWMRQRYFCTFYDAPSSRRRCGTATGRRGIWRRMCCRRRCLRRKRRCAAFCRTDPWRRMP